MEFKINMGTILTSVLGASIIGGFTGFWTVSQNTLVNTKDVEKLKEQIQDLKNSQKEDRQVLYEILKEVQK